MTLRMKPKGIYISGWLGQSGMAFELILDESKVDHVRVWESADGGWCPDQIQYSLRTFSTDPPEEDPVIIKLDEYFLGDMVEGLVARLLESGGGGAVPWDRDAVRIHLTNTRANLHGLMHDGVIVRLQLRHDLKRHCAPGGVCFYDKVRGRWVCVE
jgi:hypothetical protein